MRVIQVEAEEFCREARTEKIHGVDFHVTLSPYFFPERLECGYDQDAGSYVIEFKYLDNEPGCDQPDQEGLVTLSLGRHTGRLLAVRIHVDRHEIKQIKMCVTDDVPKAIRQIENAKPDMRENYQAAGEVFRHHTDDITALLVPT